VAPGRSGRCAPSRDTPIWDATFARSPEGLRHKREVLREHCERIGRDPDEITVAYHTRVQPGDDPGQVAEHVSAFVDAGLNLAIMYWDPRYTNGADWSHDHAKRPGAGRGAEPV
jgi:alkanesulfonate monooxygenase SsuD/methylene tetrahydromethanopterin reductase-like flavin-dependent oxidoreductase (luciferase family)